MTRWLHVARGAQSPATKPTELTKPQDPYHTEGVLSVKSVLSEGEAPDPAQLALILDLWEERAAIREYDAGQGRAEAEAYAAGEIGLPLVHLRRFAREARGP